MKKKILSLLLAAILVFSLLPMTALADYTSTYEYKCGPTEVVVTDLSTQDNNQFKLTITQKAKNTAEYSKQTLYDNTVELILNPEEHSIVGTFTTADHTIDENSCVKSGSNTRYVSAYTNSTITIVSKGGNKYAITDGLLQVENSNGSYLYKYDYCYDVADLNDQMAEKTPFEFTFGEAVPEPAAAGEWFGYCGENSQFGNSIGLGDINRSITWAIKIPAADLPQKDVLSMVSYFVYSNGTYKVRIYETNSGVQPDGDKPDYEQEVVLLATQCWKDIVLTTPYEIDSNKDLWIGIENTDCTYPATYSSEILETEDCCMMYFQNTWASINKLGSFNIQPWMIRGYFGEVDAHTITNATTDTNGTVSIDATTAVEGATVWIAVDTDDEYYLLDTLTATYNDGSEDQSVSLKQDEADPTKYSFTMPAYDVSVKATFKSNGKELPIYRFTFETDPESSGWTNIDADGDGYKWNWLQSNKSMQSVSWSSATSSLTPDNWLISPQISIPADGAEIRWDVKEGSANYPDHYGVYLCSKAEAPSDGSDLATNYIQIYEGITLGSENLSIKIPAEYYENAYYIAFRHYNSDDMWSFEIDNFEVKKLIPEFVSADPEHPVTDEASFNAFVKGTTKWEDYTFAGWFYTDGEGKEAEFIDTYAKAVPGTTYTAKWKNAADNFVLTDGIIINEDGVYIGGSDTAATGAELEKYGLAFTPAATEPATPATLSMTNAVIEAGDGVCNDGWFEDELYWESGETDSSPVYFGLYSSINLNLVLNGDNTVRITKKDDTNATPIAVFTAYTNMTVTGSGTLTADASDAVGRNVFGLCFFATLTNSATITGKSGRATYASNGISFYALENTAGTLTGIGGSEGKYTSGVNNAGSGDINVSGGKVIGYGGTGTAEYFGLWTDGNIKVSDTGILEVHGGTQTGTGIKKALHLENSGKTITVSDSGKLIADSAVKNDGKYADYYTVTGADTDIASKSAGSTLTKSCDENIVITNKTYTVSFNTNGGTPAPNAQSTLAYATEPSSMTKDGYVFAGWYKDAAFTKGWKFGTYLDSNYARQNLALYAKWVQESAVNTVRGAVDDEDDIPVDEADVFLKRGDVIYDHYTTGTTGEFSFSNVPAGEYQLVVTKGDYTTTSLVNVFSGASINVGFVTLHMTTKTSSKVEITGNDTPDVMVGGLEHVADMKQSAGSTVSVTLEVEKLAENAVNSGDKTKIEAAADSGKTLNYIDMALLLKINDTAQPNITEIDVPLEIIIPFDLSGKNNIALYRRHGSETSAVKLPEGEANQTDDGEYVIIDKENNRIRAFLRYFSTYAIGYEEEQPSYSGGGSSSYAIELPANVANGKIEVSPKNASAGQTVTITVTPDKGFTLETLTVLDKNGKEIEVKNLGNNKYSFKMPSSKVTISATFMEDNSMLNFFVDVKATDYYYDAVLWAAENGITVGIDATHFGPDIGTTRAQVVTFLWRASGCPEPTGDASKFTDVEEGSYYEKAIAWAIEQGITVGTSETTFSPDMICTRAHIVTFLARFAGVKDADTASVFSDVASTDYYAAAVKWAKDNGVTEGTSATTFSPDLDCTRAQVVTFLYRWMVK